MFYVVSGAKSCYRFGVLIQPDSSDTGHSIKPEYTQEQWRCAALLAEGDEGYFREDDDGNPVLLINPLCIFEPPGNRPFVAPIEAAPFLWNLRKTSEGAFWRYLAEKVGECLSENYLYQERLDP